MTERRDSAYQLPRTTLPTLGYQAGELMLKAKAKTKPRAQQEPARFVKDNRITEAEHPFGARITTRVVDDPTNTSLTIDQETGLPISVELDAAPKGMRGLPSRIPVAVTASLRDDPLGRLHKRAQISDASYAAGEWMRAIFEIIDVAPVQAIDMAKPAVDGGKPPNIPISDKHVRAAKHLVRARAALGSEGYQLVREVLSHRQFIEQIGRKRGLTSKHDFEYLGRRFRECLDTLARTFQFTFEVEGKQTKTPADKHAASAVSLSNRLVRAAIVMASPLNPPPTKPEHHTAGDVLKLPQQTNTESN